MRRPLTAAAASSVLIALMFVPSASATNDTPTAAPVSATSTRTQTDTAEGASDSGLSLAATGSIDTKPYVLGGTAFLGVGAALVLFARRREAAEPEEPAESA